jgi:hypothetical protein
VIVPVEHDHLADVASWYFAHHGSELDLQYLAPVGLIEPGVAAGFLVLTTAGVAMLDGFVTNPEAPLRARRAGLTGIMERLIAMAAEAGFQRVFGMTTVHGMVALCKRQGFRKAGDFAVLVREA